MVRLLAISLFILFSTIGTTMAQGPARPPGPPQGAKAPPPPPPAVGTVGMLTGDVDSTGLRIASDLARVLDNGNELRIIPMAGKGSIQNINDLITLKAVDLAIVQSDVLTRFAKISRQPGFQTHMQYVAKLYSEEFHVLIADAVSVSARFDGTPGELRSEGQRYGDYSRNRFRGQRHRGQPALSRP